MSAHTIAMFATAPRPPITANSDIFPNLSAVSCVRKCRPWRIDAFDSPAWRPAKWNGTSAMRRFLRARISSRILKPRGLREAASTVRRSMRKNPVIGSVTSFSRIGNMARVSAVETFETRTRVRSASPTDVPPPA